MYLNVTQVSPVFQGTIRFKTAQVLKKGDIVETLENFPIDANEIKRIDPVRVDTEAFARELGLPNIERAFMSLKKSVDKACDEVSLVTLYNNMKYRMSVAKERVLEAYQSVLNNDSEVIL